MTDIHAKAEVVTGDSFWTTADHPEVGAPRLVVADGPHGLRRPLASDDALGIGASHPATCFPPAVGLGACWDPDLVQRVGAALGLEARALGVSVLLGPGVNLKRMPLCGRNFEYLSEDPFISGRLGAAHVRGVQSEGVGTCVKHFAANNQETGRMQISVDIDERTLRELYLAAFERIVKEANPASLMCSYNRINGVYSAENPWLLTQVLREEWGFDGAVISDWGAVHDRAAALAAGLDLAMPGPRARFVDEVERAVTEGRLAEAVLDRAVARVAQLALVPPTHREPIDFDAHHDLAREVAADCVILLRNEGAVLPLRQGHIAAVGPFVERPRYQGGGSSHVNPARLDSPIDELRALAEPRGIEVHAHAGDDLVAARSLAAGVDVAVVFTGLQDEDESEGFDRSTTELSDTQVELIRVIASTGTPTIVVLSHGGVVTLEAWHDDVAAILDASLLGQGGGAAVARVLFGDVNPSARLTETIPRRMEDHPAWLNFPGELGHVRYGEGVFVGYRYFSTARVPVRYPFGHGLSYTLFASRLAAVEVTGPTTALARIEVTNTGSVRGKQVVQLYVGCDTGRVRRPVRELKAFTKVELDPGETRVVELPLGHDAFAFWDVANRRWSVSGGPYRVDLADSAEDVIESVVIDLAGDEPPVLVTMDSSVEEWLAAPAVGPVLRQRLVGVDDLELFWSMPMNVATEFFQLPAAELEQMLALQTGA